MPISIALAGNPNSGKTTMFNDLTGSSQYVGNWPGVTVEKKEGKLRGNKEVLIQDLPGIYSLSPYTLEEVVSRDYLVDNQPNAIINIVDASNIERNLYLTTQLAELGLPMVIALNMFDVVRKTGDKIDTAKLGEMLGCIVVETSALKGEGTKEVARIAIEQAQKTTKKEVLASGFNSEIEETLEKIKALISGKVPVHLERWYSIKLFERDKEILKKLALNKADLTQIEDIILACENEYDDDSESIITSERYGYIDNVIRRCFKVKNRSKLTNSDKIDKIVTNRILALPIFALVMFLVYFLSISTVGTMLTDWVNEGVFGEGFHLVGGAAFEEAVELAAEAGLDDPDPTEFGIWIDSLPVMIDNGLSAIGTSDWLSALILDGIVGGVGAVLGFLPQMLVLFLCLAILEDCGYMARIAFIMDRIFRKFGLSGKSFIPILIGTGCGVPGIMASRTIENESDRRMTVITTTFIPCGAKLPIIALITGALFPDSIWIAPSCYFIGIAAIIFSGIILKKTKPFAGDPAPFVMELPAYHLPGVKGVLITMWERGKSFVKKAGTIILLSCIVLWFFSSFSWSFQMVENAEESIMATIGNIFAPLFAPLGWGDWKAAVATINGLIAKENVVGAFGILYGFAEVAEDGAEFWPILTESFTQVAAYSFLVFNLLCAPCFAAIGAVRREMMNSKWTWFAVGYQCAFAYFVALLVNQFGLLFTGGGFGFGTVIAIVALAAFVWLIIRKPSSSDSIQTKRPKLAAK